MPEASTGSSLKENWKCILACTLVSMSPFQYGLDFGLIGGLQAMPGFLMVNAQVHDKRKKWLTISGVWTQRSQDPNGLEYIPGSPAAYFFIDDIGSFHQLFQCWYDQTKKEQSIR